MRMANNAEETSISSESHCNLLQLERSQEACSSTSSEIIREECEITDEGHDHVRYTDATTSGGAERNMAWKQAESTSATSSSDSETEYRGHVVPLLTRPSPLSSFGLDVVPMAIDTCEDLWTRLHDIRINGCVLEYAGRGKSIYDNGLAQSNAPLSPTSHYFEVTIIHPGENCYIAIGLARKDYPSHKHPGWNRGSIAYHADDGKIFIGSGIGTPFGPRCHLNDVLGCGIVFPNSNSAQKLRVEGNAGHGEAWPWDSQGKVKINYAQSPEGNNLPEGSSESEDDIWWNNRNQVYEDKVQVFFMRNGKLLGMKEIRIPKGGFFPTIGMMSQDEKVMLDMNPLTG